jgi:hypothetical protein
MTPAAVFSVVAFDSGFLQAAAATNTAQQSYGTDDY